MLRGVFGQSVVPQVVFVAHKATDVTGVAVQLGAGLCVEVQVPLVSEDLATELAGELLLAVFPLLVGVQCRLLDRHPANVTAMAKRELEIRQAVFQTFSKQYETTDFVTQCQGP